MAVADIECAKRASLSLGSSERIVGVGASLLRASSTAAMCLNGGSSGDGVCSAVPTPVSGSGGVDVSVLRGLPSFDRTFESMALCVFSCCGACASLSSSGGQVVCAFLASTEIAVGGDSSVSSLGVGIFVRGNGALKMEITWKSTKLHVGTKLQPSQVVEGKRD